MLRAEALRERRSALIALRAALSAALVAVLLLAAGCGDDEEPGSGVTGGKVTTELTITLDRDGSGGADAEAADVACGEQGAGADPACDALAGLEASELAPVAPGMACTQIYGGPDEATVEGTLKGEAVEATLTRANGCEIERFQRIAPVLRELFPGYRPGASPEP